MAAGCAGQAMTPNAANFDRMPAAVDHESPTYRRAYLNVLGSAISAEKVRPWAAADVSGADKNDGFLKESSKRGKGGEDRTRIGKSNKPGEGGLEARPDSAREALACGSYMLAPAKTLCSHATLADSIPRAALTGARGGRSCGFEPCRRGGPARTASGRSQAQTGVGRIDELHGGNGNAQAEGTWKVRETPRDAVERRDDAAAGAQQLTRCRSRSEVPWPSTSTSGPEEIAQLRAMPLEQLGEKLARARCELPDRVCRSGQEHEYAD